MRQSFEHFLRPGIRAGLLLAMLLPGPNLIAQQIQQWDFDNGDLTATVGSDLQYSDGPGGATQTGTAFGTTTSFGIPDISGTAAKVMKFPAAENGMGYLMPPLSNANGGDGAGLVNDYTIIFDLLYPQSSDAMFRPLLDTDGNIFVEGPDMAIDISDGLGVGPSGPFYGTVTPNTWNRVGVVVQQDQKLLTWYINGARVGSTTLSGSQSVLDGRFALSTTVATLILATTDTNAAPGYVNSIQLRDVALNVGQMKALGGASASGIPQTIPAVPSFIDTRAPDFDQKGVSPTPTIHILLNQGDTVVDANSIKLYMDGALLPATLTPAAPTFTLDYSITNILRALSTHELDLVYSDSVVGLQTNSWTFTVTDYQKVFLPTPFYLETFDELAEGTLPPGWVVTNNTDTIDTGFDLSDPKSDAYKDFVVVNTNTIASITLWDASLRLSLPPIVLNGALLPSLANNNFAYAESDQRSGNQVQVMFTSDIDCTGHTNVFVAWKHIYEQNQDNIGSVEYSIDQGQTWLPVLYELDDGTTDGDGSDVVTNSSTHQIDVFATFGTPRSDQAYGLAYSNFIGAVVSTNLIPYISPERNDDPLSSKRIEIIRLPAADNQPHVRFRFGQAGTASWFFGIDDLGLYSINTPVITGQPTSQSVDANSSATFTVTATGSGTLKYQWEFNGNSIVDATNSSYTISSASVTNGGLYDVVVSNSDGPTSSGTAQLTVISTPQFVSQPVSQVADPNDSVVLTSGYRGGRPIGSYWLLNSTVLPNSSVADVVNTLTFNSAATNNSGIYQLVVTNSYGSITSGVAQLTVFSGPITNALVVHLTFDGNLNDSSGRGNNAAYANNGASGDPTPTFISGKIGQAFEFTTLKDGSKFDYATLGYPADLQFGDTNAVSISFWINYTNQDDDLPFISNKDWNSSGNGGWGIFAQSAGDFRVNFTGTNGGNDKLDYHPTTVLRDGTWHNVVLSIARAPSSQAYAVYTYVDGIALTTRTMFTQGTIDTLALPFQNEQSATTSQTNWAVNIGQDGTGVYHDQGSAYNIAAHIDDVGIWRRALTPREAANIFVQGQKGQDLTTASGAAVVLPATIAADPVSQVISAGASATFSVTPAGTPPFTFAWQRDGAPFGGSTSSNLTFNAVSLGDVGGYAAVVSNAGGSATSHVAQLIVFTGSITQELVAHLKFDGDYSDSSGNGTAGTAVGSPSFQSGMIGQAVHVTSAGTPANNPSPNNYVALGMPSQLMFGTNDFSISFWAKITSQNDDKPFISNKNWGSGGNLGWALATEGDGMKWNFKDDQSGRRDSSDVAPQLEDGNWHSVVVSFLRSGPGRTYVDGQLVDVTSVSPDTGKPVGSADTTNSVNIGQDGTGLYTDGGGAAAVDMLVDDLGIWRRVVTPQETLAIYNAGKAGLDLTKAGQATPTPTLQFNSSSGNITLTWNGAANLKLQKTSSLSAPTWTDVSGTTGASTYSEPETNSPSFYRVFGP